MATLTSSSSMLRSKAPINQSFSFSFLLKPSPHTISSSPLKITPPLTSTLKTLKPISSSLHLTTPLRSSIDPITSDLSTTPTAPPSLKARLRNGETLYGLFLLTFSPTLAEIAGLAGYDFVVVDMEHGHGGTSDALPCLHALAATRTPAILRIPESCPTWAKKALDLGPQGIMFPMIDSPKMARKAVSYCRFPPNGVRGSAHTVVRASSYGIDAGYLNNYEEELLIMCQVESEEGAEKIKEIAAVDGVDCVQMGPLDLSASMGYLWDPGHKKVKEVLRKAEKAVLGTKPPTASGGGGGSSNGGGGGGAFLSGFAMPHDSPENLRSRGYHMVAGALDIGLFRNAAVEDVKKFRAKLVADTSEEAVAGEEVGDEKYWSE